ncbi:hypothetical protein BOX15_Mlig029354g1 [Macrostomum lignano]|uniref:Uncharacterized protein n=1 Tax=Macrostomum lignano TaxID=282301 RepID=A0A267GI52_9PLAT|nr:hypothetical protein BOX15_Mlig029354g1 [Macrostomum lignano]
MRARLRTVTGAAQEVAGITRTHGLLHIFLSRSTARRIFWLLLFVAALIGCTVHLAKLVQKFTDRSVESQLKLRSERAQFPDVTICNFKPASTGLMEGFFLNDTWKSSGATSPTGSRRTPRSARKNQRKATKIDLRRCVRSSWT